MSNPLTIGAAFKGVGYGVEAAGSLWAGAQSAKASKAKAEALERQAALRIEKGIFDSSEAGTKYQRSRGSAVSMIGNTGLDIASFSDVLADAAIESALEQKVIMFQAEQEAANLRAQAQQARDEAKAAKTGSIFKAVGTAAKIATVFI